MQLSAAALRVEFSSVLEQTGQGLQQLLTYLSALSHRELAAGNRASVPLAELECQ